MWVSLSRNGAVASTVSSGTEAPRPLLPSRLLAPPRSDVVCSPPLQIGYDADMAQGRRRRGFEHVGRFPASQLGLPPRLARELLLATAWRHVAGGTIARRVTVRVSRGVLEIRVPDEQWATMISELIPRIAGRMAAAYPQLGVRRFRVQREVGTVKKLLVALIIGIMALAMFGGVASAERPGFDNQCAHHISHTGDKDGRGPDGAKGPCGYGFPG